MSKTFQELSEYDQRKIAFLRKVVTTIEELNDNTEDEDANAFFEAEIKELTHFLKYFELKDQG